MIASSGYILFGDYVILFRSLGFESRELRTSAIGEECCCHLSVIRLWVECEGAKVLSPIVNAGRVTSQFRLGD